MFDFQKLTVYQHSKDFYSECRELLSEYSFDKSIRDQLMRASLSVSLNIAEGSGRTSKPDRRKFFIIARSSTYECVAILDLVSVESRISETRITKILSTAEQISKILFTMIKNLSEQK